MQNLSYKIGIGVGVLLVVVVIVILITSFVRGWNQQGEKDKKKTTEGFAQDDDVVKEAREAETKINSVVKKLENPSKKQESKRSTQREDNDDDEDDDDEDVEGFYQGVHPGTPKKKDEEEDETEYVTGVHPSSSLQEYAPVQ